MKLKKKRKICSVCVGKGYKIVPVFPSKIKLKSELADKEFVDIKKLFSTRALNAITGAVEAAQLGGVIITNVDDIYARPKYNFKLKVLDNLNVDFFSMNRNTGTKTIQEILECLCE